MIKVLKQSLDIDIAYSTNSFIYILQQIPILKDLITNDIYSNKIVKKVIKIGIVLYLFLKILALKFFYFFLIFCFSYYVFFNTLIKTYFHIYFCLTLLGIFINNKLLNTNKKKYFSLISLNMDGIKFFQANLLGNQLSNLIFNSICIFFFGYLINSPIKYNIMLLSLSFFSRLIGEEINLIFYKKKKYIWYSNLKLYWTIILVFISMALLPYFNIYFSLSTIKRASIIISILGSISLYFLLQIKDYKFMYKKLSKVVNIMDSKNDKDYLKQLMVEVKEKDKEIDKKKIEGKKGYDLFNTIFYERHKHILIRSAQKYSIILIGIYIIVGYFCMTNSKYQLKLEHVLNNKIGIFYIIMYFINRGGIVTQAMFFNCDHAMLTYNFYKEPKTILTLFKKRLNLLIKINLLPAIIISIGNSILMVLLYNTNFLTVITMFLFIICLSIFFSIHYLAIYYLLQPFDKNMEVKKVSYSFATLATYTLSYIMANTNINSVYLSLISLVGTVIYIKLSLKLVYLYAPKTFKLN